MWGVHLIIITERTQACRDPTEPIKATVDFSCRALLPRMRGTVFQLVKQILARDITIACRVHLNLVPQLRVRECGQLTYRLPLRPLFGD